MTPVDEVACASTESLETITSTVSTVSFVSSLDSESELETEPETDPEVETEASRESTGPMAESKEQGEGEGVESLPEGAAMTDHAAGHTTTANDATPSTTIPEDTDPRARGNRTAEHTLLTPTTNAIPANAIPTLSPTPTEPVDSLRPRKSALKATHRSTRSSSLPPRPARQTLWSVNVALRTVQSAPVLPKRKSLHVRFEGSTTTVVVITEQEPMAIKSCSRIAAALRDEPSEGTTDKGKRRERLERERRQGRAGQTWRVLEPMPIPETILLPELECKVVMPSRKSKKTIKLSQGVKSVPAAFSLAVVRRWKLKVKLW